MIRLGRAYDHADGFAAMQADTSEGGRGFQGVLHVSLNLMWSRFDARSDCRLSIL